MYLWLEECGLINGTEDFKEGQKKEPATDQSENQVLITAH